ncbi:MAG: glutamate mutase L [Clostridia bacterium]|nr:glutamate mutase L [Clostridia bacterium]
MKLDVLVAEIGSTTTVVNAFHDLGGKEPLFLGQGQAPTSVLQGDVRVGLRGAMDDLCRKNGWDDLEYHTMLATSSAAGGLRMTVHGLVYDMTVRAAREAALGAGANLHLVTAGVMEDEDLEELREIHPNLILIAGGTDYGERETALKNARRIRELNLNVPVIYAGNVQNQARVERIFQDAGAEIYLTENVYPRLDELNIEPARKIIHQVFEKHIVHAPGMEQVRELVTGSIIPTPGAVMECARLLYEEVGDLVVLDVGGATTDVHSVTEGSEEIASIQLSPEPMAKRTVEGDLGVFVNARSMARQIGMEQLSKEIGMDAEPIFQHYKAIPDTEEQFRLTEQLAWHAASAALERHAGRFRYTYGSNGRQTFAEGKDLTQVKYLVATGGALTRLPGRKAIMERLRHLNDGGKLLFPKAHNLALLEDKNYYMASLGVLSRHDKEAARRLLLRDMDLEKEDCDVPSIDR